jgi:hypothetical protein
MKMLLIWVFFALPLRALADGQGQYKNSAENVAATFGVSLATAQSARAHNVEELLGWSMMLMAQRGHCSVAELIRRRKTMSWGEVAQSTGWDWGQLMKEVLARAKQAGLRPTPGNEEQRHRGAANDPELLPAWKAYNGKQP